MQLLPALFFLNSGSSYWWSLLEKHCSCSIPWTPQLNLCHLQTVPPITWPWTEYLPRKASLFGYQSLVHKISLASSLELRGQRHRSKRKTSGMKGGKPTMLHPCYHGGQFHLRATQEANGGASNMNQFCQLPFHETINNPGGASGKEPVCQCRRHKRCGFEPWVRKIPWRRKWLPTPALLPGESHRQRSLVG